MSSPKASLVKAYLSSSIGRKQIVSVTGLFMLLGFLIPHLLGNLFFFLGADAYNQYAAKLHHLGPLLKVMEVVLLAAVALHIIITLSLVLENFKSRGPKNYSGSTSSAKRSIATRTMPITGILILVFIILHLMSFKFGEAPKLGDHKDVYQQALTLFSSPTWLACYLFFMISVGLHVSHALKSGFQTFGLIPAKHTTAVERASLTLGIAMLILFGAIPIVAYTRVKGDSVNPPVAAAALAAPARTTEHK